MFLFAIASHVRPEQRYPMWSDRISSTMAVNTGSVVVAYTEASRRAHHQILTARPPVGKMGDGPYQVLARTAT
jgi:hypothetical protein